MGPKQGKKKAPMIIDGVSTTEMSREQLERFALTLKETVDREREERNFFQLERDKIRTFWEICRQQLDECRAELRNKDREMEENENDHQNQARLFRQKVKHLLYEHHSSIGELRADASLSLKLSQEDFEDQERELLNDKKNFKQRFLDQQKERQDEIRSLNMQFSEQLSKARSDFESEAREIERKYEDRLDTQKTELGLRHSMEITEVDERKNKQITDLMKNHDRAFNEMKNYYNDITLNNLALISSLKEQMEEMKRREDRTDKALKEAQKEILRISGPAKLALAENRELKRRLANYQKDLICLANTKRILAETQKELESFKWENEILSLRLQKIEEDRDNLRDKFGEAIMEVQQRLNLKTVLLKKKLGALVDLIDEREAEFRSVVVAARVDSDTLKTISVRVESLLTRKNSAIQDLEYELARVCKAHDDLLQTYEGKLVQYGIPKEELGFIPLRTGVPTGRGPAGLVTCNR